MILVTVRMKVLAEKRLGLSQTIALPIGFLRTEKGCGPATFTGVWRMKMNSVFLKNGIPGRTLIVT